MSDGKHPNQVANWIKPGETRNPGGKPVGSRNRLTKKFLYELAEDFEIHGREVLQKCREDRPDVYIKVIAALCPKEVEIKRPLQEMEDAELLTAVRALESFLDARSAQNGTGEASGGESVN